MIACDGPRNSSAANNRQRRPCLALRFERFLFLLVLIEVRLHLLVVVLVALLLISCLHNNLQHILVAKQMFLANTLRIVLCARAPHQCIIKVVQHVFRNLHNSPKTKNNISRIFLTVTIGSYQHARRLHADTFTLRAKNNWFLELRGLKIQLII